MFRSSKSMIRSMLRSFAGIRSALVLVFIFGCATVPDTIGPSLAYRMGITGTS